MADSPLTFWGQQTLPDTAPVPLESAYDLASGDFSITFDQVLHSQPVSVATILFELNNLAVTTLSAVASGNKVTGTSSTVAGPPQADTVTYTESPPHIRSSKLVPAPAFPNFAVVVT